MAIRFRSSISLAIFTVAVLGSLALGCDSAPEPPEQGCTPTASTSGPVGEWELLGLSGDDIDNITAIAVHPCDPQVIYAGSSFNFSDGIQGKLFKSEDGGQTWDTLRTGGSYHDIQFNPSNPDILYALSGALLKSTDGGQSWTNILNHAGSETSVRSMAIHPEHADVLYVGTSGFFGGGLYKSTNDGASWEMLEGDESLENRLKNGITSIAIDSQHPNTVYVGTAWSGSLVKSTDGGKRWTVLMDTGRIIDFLSASHWNGRVYVGVRFEGLLSSDDGGITWDPEALPDSVESIADMFFHPEGQGAYVATDKGVFYEPSETANWSSMNEGLSHEFITALSMPSKGWDLYLGLRRIQEETGIYVRQIER